MSGKSTSLVRSALAAVLCVRAAAPAAAATSVDPFHFFEGRTEGAGTVKVVFHKAYKTHSLGVGRIQPDGSLFLVQQVQDEGQPVHERRWLIRQTSPHHFAGTMSEAVGPVVVDEVAGRYRFRFKIKGNLSVEQWLAPLANGLSAQSQMTVRKYGMSVGTSDGTIRKLVGG